MPEKKSKLSLFFAELKRRKVTRLATVYTVVGIGVIEISDIIGGRFLIPDFVIQLIIVLVIIGFPVAIILGWIFDITSKGIQRTESLTPQEKTSLAPFTWKPSWISLILLFVIIALTITYCTVPRPNALGFKKQDWIIISDLENNTDDEIFDNSLTHALSVTIDQSKYVSVFPSNQIQAVLKRMRMDSVKRVNTPIALEIAQRENIKAVISLAISGVGDTYLISSNLLNPETGETIKSRSVTLKGKSEILIEMNKLALKVRKDLGEALNEIHLRTLPLQKATTSSLEALKSATEGYNAWANGNLEEGKRLLIEAIDIDPEFALAHAQLGSIYYWESQRDKGEEHFEKALAMVERLTEREKLSIEARIERFRGKYDEAIIKYGIFLKKYPNNSNAWFGLAYSYMRLQRHEEAINAFIKSLEVYQEKDPNTYINIASCYTMMKRFEESIDYYLRAFDLNPNLLTVNNLNHEFGFAYVGMGEFDKAQEVFEKMMIGTEEQKASGLRSQALLSMYQGQFAKAIEQMNESTSYYKSLGYEVSELRNRLYLASIFRTKGFMNEFHAELENANRIVKNSSIEPWWILLLGKFYARNGETQKAETLLDILSKLIIEGNRDDQAAYNILKGEIELAKGNQTESISNFESAIKIQRNNYTLESLATSFYISGQQDKAIAIYKEIIGPEKSLGWEGQQYSIDAYYRLGLIYEEMGENDQAIKYFQSFLDTWQNADEDLPVLMDVKERLEKIETIIP